MQLEKSLSRKRNVSRFKMRWLFFSFLLALLITGIIISLLYYIEEQPNQTKVDVYPAPIQIGDAEAYFFPLIYQGELMDEQVIVEGTELYVPFELFKEKIDSHISWDEENQTVIVTNANEVITLNNKYLNNELKDEKVELQFPVKVIEGNVYVPFSPFEAMYPVQFKKYEQYPVIELQEMNFSYLIGEFIIQEQEEKNEAYIRTDKTIKAPFVQKVKGGAEIKVLSEENNWYHVQTLEGALGYVQKELVSIKEIKATKKEMKREETEFVPWNPIGGKINLTWEHVVRRTPNPDQIRPPSGVNVVSPTWFHLHDDEGNLRNIADKPYVEWAHKNGYKVWGVVTNDFNPDRTHTVLSDYNKRKQMILQLLYYAELYQLDGINIDFENVYLKDKENLVQFMRELTPYLHEQGLVVSIDVTIKSTSEMWSLFLDRQALAEIVDYIMVMTYDEHWAASPIAGSVASLPWVERGLQGVLEEVANDKLLLGVPFYTRIWKEEIDENGNKKVTSKAYSMEAVENWLKEHQVEIVFQEEVGQHYGEYYDEKEKALYQVWIEDELSMEKRIQLVHKYNLAGVASWRRGFEKPEIWNVIKESLEKRL